jgi:hypothetical protein
LNCPCIFANRIKTGKSVWIDCKSHYDLQLLLETLLDIVNIYVDMRQNNLWLHSVTLCNSRYVYTIKWSRLMRYTNLQRMHFPNMYSIRVHLSTLIQNNETYVVRLHFHSNIGICMVQSHMSRITETAWQCFVGNYSPHSEGGGCRFHCNVRNVFQ